MNEQSGRKARIASRLCAGLACALSLAPSRVWAQSADGSASVLVVTVALRGDPDDFGAPRSMRVAAATGPDVAVGPLAAGRVAERYGSRPVTGDPLAPVRERSAAARRAWQQGTLVGDPSATAAALVALEAASRELEAAPVQLDNPANLQSVRESLIFLAEHYGPQDPGRADDAMRRFAGIDPAYAFQVRDASAAVQRDYAHAVATLPRGGLIVEAAEPGCTVFRNGLAVGPAPVELQNLPVGGHRISLVCGPLRSLVHPVNISANSRATIRIDPQIDAALGMEHGVLLRYESAAQARERVVRHLAVLGRAHGARRVYAVMAHEDTVTVVDVATGSEVGQSPVTDGSRLRLLVTQPVAAVRAEPVPAPAAPAIAPTPTPTPAPVVVVLTSQRAPRGAPVGAIVLGTLGLGIAGAGVYAHFLGEDALHLARQNGSHAEDTAVTWRQEQNTRELMQWIEIGGYGLGGIAVVAAVLIGVFGGDAAEPPPRVRAGVMPLPGGGLFTFEGTL